MSLTQVRMLMNELCFNGMARCLDEVLHQVQEGAIGMVEALDRLLQSEKQSRSQKATQARILRSKIRRGASLEEFDLTQGRQITKTHLRELEFMRWCQEGRPLILIGSTGVGKTYLARALGLRACEYGKHVLFFTVTEFLENQAITRGSNTYLRFRDKLTRPDLLLLDHFGMRKFTSQEAEDLRDILEQRSYGKSTLVASQLPLQHWREVIGDEIIFDALIDRLEPPGFILTLTGESYRKQMGRKELVEKESQNS